MADVAMAPAETHQVPDSPLLVEDDAPGAAKSEDERQDVLAVQALERRRKAALAANGTPAAKPTGGSKRKRPVVEEVTVEEERKEEDEGEERLAKRRRRQSNAVLLDTGRIKTMLTATTLVNLRPMMYLSASLRWGPGPPLGVRRGACAVALLDENRLLVVGGNEGKVAVGTTEVLDLAPLTGYRMSFHPGPVLGTQRRECSIVPLDEFRLLVVGGYDGEQFLTTTEIVDARTMRVTPGPRMVHRRAAPAVARFEGLDRIIVVGGKNAFGCLETTEVLDTRAEPLEFKPGPSLRMQRAGPTAVPLDANRVIVLGGHDSSRTHNTTEILHVLDPGARAPRIACSLGPLLPAPRSYFAGVMVNAGNVHIIGGHDGYEYLNSTEVLNLSTMEYTTGPTMRKKRFMCAASLIAEDRVMVLGGTDVTTDHHSTELLRLPTYSFAPAPWMSTS